MQDVRRLRRRQTVHLADPRHPVRWRRDEGDGGRARDLGERAAGTEVAVRRALAAGKITRAAVVVARGVAAESRQPAHVKGEQGQQDDEDGAPHGPSIARAEPDR